MKSDPVLMRVVAATERSKGRRSRLFRWMRQNYEPLRKAFSVNGPGWSEQIKVFTEAGLTDRNGNPPSYRTTRQTWYRVCRDVRSQSLSPGRSEPRSPLPTSGTLRPYEELPHPKDTKADTDAWAKVWGEMDRRSGRVP